MKYTIKTDCIYEEKIKKSTFIGYLKYVENLDDCRTFIKHINNLHPQANHNCPAYVIGKNGEISFSSDAGEPSGTAGKPILNAIFKHNLSNVCIVVARYFGGVKLGVRGLIEAYGSIADSTILQGEKDAVIDYYFYDCIMTYDFYNIFLHRIGDFDVEISNTTFTDNVNIKIKVSEFTNEDLYNFLSELKNAGKLISFDSNV